MQLNKENTSSVDDDEVKKFSSMSDNWWDPNGKLKTLHDINLVRMSYIQDRLTKHFFTKENPYLDTLKVLDIGCGGGILSEPLSRLGYNVTGIDASESNINIAKLHRDEHKLKIEYICTTAEDLAEKSNLFDVIFCLEIIEHVKNPDQFIHSCSQMLKPGGMIFFSTINRTMKSYLTAIVGAEYVLRWLPIGTHSWKKFLKPSEIDSAFRRRQIKTIDITGITYNPIKPERWVLSKNIDVNYIMAAVK